MNPSEKEAYDFLLPLYADSIRNSTDKLFVTLTYASSLDALISGKDGQPLLLSGQESMVMTHALRALHDGILVGIGTVLNDNPSLTIRYVGHSPHGGGIEKHPIPIVLDSNLRIPIDCKVANRNPIIVVSSGALESPESHQKAVLLEGKGATLLPCQQLDNGRLDVSSAFQRLYRHHNVKSVMIEGGASVIRSMLVDHSSLIDQVIVTAPPLYPPDLFPSDWIVPSQYDGGRLCL